MLKDGKKELDAHCKEFGFSHYNWQSSKVSLNDPHLPVFMPLCELFPLNEPSDSFLTNRIWQEYRVSLVKLSYRQNVASILCALLCFVCLL